MYVIELAIKLSPMPLLVERKHLRDAQALYRHICQSIEKDNPHLIELTCEKLEDKKVAVLSDQILAVQIYQKASGLGGSKRPGFSFES